MEEDGGLVNTALSQAELRAARSLTSPPSRFDDFWTETRSELLAVDPKVLPNSNVDRDSHRDTPIPASFQSLNGARVGCWFSGSPRASEQYTEQKPLLVTAHGYGSSVDPGRIARLGALGFDVVGVDVRGCGSSRDAAGTISPHGYLLTFAETPENSILRGAVCDYAQAARAARAWYGAPKRVTYHGFSFGGALALMAAALPQLGRRRLGRLAADSNPAIADAATAALVVPDLVAVGAPSLGDHPQRLRLSKGGSGKELADFVHHFPELRDRTMLTMNFFDTVHFAPHVTCRVIAGVGLFDPVVPALTVYSIYNALPRSPELHEMPFSHTERPEEQQWIRWDSAWIRATQGRDGQSM